MKQRYLLAPETLFILLLTGCGAWNTFQSSPSASSPIATDANKTASISAANPEADNMPKAPAEVFREELPHLKQETGVPILLPSELPALDHPIYVSSSGDRNSYLITLSSAPSCTANACFIGIFQAERGKQPDFDQSVSLANNLQGYYKPLSCGASCSPPAIEWMNDAVLYEIALSFPSRDEADAKTVLSKLANSAIEAGSR